MELVLYHGGYSLASSTDSIKLEDTKRYIVDGTQMLFLITNTAQNNLHGKPYFSLAVRKITDRAFTADT